jgi:hypothetical protein
VKSESAVSNMGSEIVASKYLDRQRKIGGGGGASKENNFTEGML